MREKKRKRRKKKLKYGYDIYVFVLSYHFEEIKQKRGELAGKGRKKKTLKGFEKRVRD